MKKLHLKNYSLKRQFVTLIEMMIVMFLIALITGVVAYNYRGSLDEGKVFQTKTAMSKLETILNLEIAKKPEEREQIQSEWKKIIEQSPLVHDAKVLTRDGWGEEFQVNINENTGGVEISSRKYNEYTQQHRK